MAFDPRPHKEAEQRARAANLAATFQPADEERAGPLPEHLKEEEAASWPSITVAGAQVFAYVDQFNTLVVSVHVDTGEIPDWLRNDDEHQTVPLSIKVGHEIVYSASPKAPATAVKFDPEAARYWLTEDGGWVADELDIDHRFNRLNGRFPTLVRDLIDWLDDHPNERMWDLAPDVRGVRIWLPRPTNPIDAHPDTLKVVVQMSDRQTLTGPSIETSRLVDRDDTSGVDAALEVLQTVAYEAEALVSEHRNGGTR